MELRFPRPDGPPPLSINEANKMHWAAKRRRLEPWREAVGWAWKLSPPAARRDITDVPCSVQITIGFRTGAQRDPHNYVGTVCKALVDQLVQQGVWPDDTPQWVTVPEPVCVKGGEVIVRLVPSISVEPDGRRELAQLEASG